MGPRRHDLNAKDIVRASEVHNYKLNLQKSNQIAFENQRWLSPEYQNNDSIGVGGPEHNEKDGFMSPMF